MPLWRCPHCSTPQAETSRCWVCHRSTTACATCRHFRRSVAAQLGYCGLDRQRRPLRGDEIRSCWESAGALGPGAADNGIAGGRGVAPGVGGTGAGVAPGARSISTSVSRSVGPIAVGGSAAPVLHEVAGTPVRKLEFVEVLPAARSTKAAKAAKAASRRTRPADAAGGEPGALNEATDDAPIVPAVPAEPAGEPRWSLWGDPES